jgi:hypothetical protein
MHRRPLWHPETQRIYLPSGFVVTMPRPAEVDEKLNRFEQSLAADHLAKQKRDGEIRYPHPCIERFAQQQARQGNGLEQMKIRQKHLWRQYEQIKLGQRGACPHELPVRELRTNVGRDELKDMQWNHRHFGKNDYTDPTSCGLCLRDAVAADRWMKGTEVQLIDIAPVYRAQKAANSTKQQGVAQRIADLAMQPLSQSNYK